MRFNRTRDVSMGRDADACPASLCDVRRNHYGGQRVQTTRLATGALRRPPRGNTTRGGASSQEEARRLVAHRLAVASRAITEAGSSRDGRRNSARPSLGSKGDQAEPEILGLRRG
jgi:hypothetical protein